MLGILSSQRLWGWWRQIIFGVFVFAAIATPTGDPVNLSLLAFPILGLGFIAMGIAFFNHRRRVAVDRRGLTSGTTRRPRRSRAERCVDDRAGRRARAGRPRPHRPALARRPGGSVRRRTRSVALLVYPISPGGRERVRVGPPRPVAGVGPGCTSPRGQGLRGRRQGRPGRPVRGRRPRRRRRDGMVHVGVQCVAGTEFRWACPDGTGNDFATALGLPPMTRRRSAGHRGLAGPHRRCRPDPVQRRAAVVRRVLSSGFDSAVNERANRMRWPKGRSRYNIAIVAESASSRPCRSA